GTSDLSREAVSAFQALFKTDPMTGYPANDPQLVRGTSPFGWSYVQIQKTLGPVGEGGPGIILFMALAGDQLATVFTVSKRPLVSQCFGEAFPSEWPAFFHSLRFKAWPPKVADAEMKTKLAGKWTTSSAHAIDNLTLANNGRYANGAALGNATRISATTVLWTMNTFRGNGAWSVKGASLLLKPDQGAAEGGTFRLEQESKDGRALVRVALRPRQHRRHLLPPRPELTDSVRRGESPCCCTPDIDRSSTGTGCRVVQKTPWRTRDEATGVVGSRPLVRAARCRSGCT
ncbi:MAG: hypothetical protein ACXWLI_01040, partial [Myxococcaceae bacterium]